MFEIVISILVALCYGVSASLQKYSLSSMDRFSVRKILKNKKWLAAFGLGILGIMIYLYALRFVALNTIQPILALSMVIPVMVGMFLFKEKPGIHEITGIILIIIGVIWISV